MYVDNYRNIVYLQILCIYCLCVLNYSLKTGDCIKIKTRYTYKLDSKYRLWGTPASYLFILAGFLAIASVFHWLVAALQPDIKPRPVYHMISSIQAFLTCMVAAFSFIWMKKNNGRQSVLWVMTALVVSASVTTAVTAWLRYAVKYEIMLGISEICWLILALGITFTAFANKSFPKYITTHESLIWLPVTLTFGICGAILVSTYSSIFVMSGNEIWWVLFLGRGFLLQCMMLSIIIAVVPVILPQAKSPDKIIHGHPATRRLPHFLYAVLLALSIPVELWFPPLGLGVRALLTYVLIIHATGLWRPYRRNSPLSWCVWSAAWLFPMGYAIAAIPGARLIGLHLIFIGGFTLGPLAAALQWLLEDNEKIRRRIDRPLPIAFFAGFLMLSLLLRAINETTPEARIYSWGHSTMTYIAGVLIWMYLILAVLRGRLR